MPIVWCLVWVYLPALLVVPAVAMAAWLAP